MMQATSAMPDRIKWENAAQELIRRVNNTSRGLHNSREEKIKAINTFMKTMKLSNYPEDFRRKTVISALKGVQRMEMREKEGGRKIYRFQSEGANDRHKNKLQKKSNWFKKKQVPQTTDTLSTTKVADKSQIPARKTQPSYPKSSNPKDLGQKMTEKLKESFLFHILLRAD